MASRSMVLILIGLSTSSHTLLEILVRPKTISCPSKYELLNIQLINFSANYEVTLTLRDRRLSPIWSVVKSVSVSNVRLVDKKGQYFRDSEADCPTLLSIDVDVKSSTGFSKKTRMQKGDIKLEPSFMFMLSGKYNVEKQKRFVLPFWVDFDEELAKKAELSLKNAIEKKGEFYRVISLITVNFPGKLNEEAGRTAEYDDTGFREAEISSQYVML